MIRAQSLNVIGRAVYSSPAGQVYRAGQPQAGGEPAAPQRVDPLMRLETVRGYLSAAPCHHSPIAARDGAAPWSRVSVAALQKALQIALVSAASSFGTNRGTLCEVSVSAGGSGSSGAGRNDACAACTMLIRNLQAESSRLGAITRRRRLQADLPGDRDLNAPRQPSRPPQSSAQAADNRLPAPTPHPGGTGAARNTPNSFDEPKTAYSPH